MVGVFLELFMGFVLWNDREIAFKFLLFTAILRAVCEASLAPTATFVSVVVLFIIVVSTHNVWANEVSLE